MPKKTDYLSALEGAIQLQHQCKPTHRETVFVKEKLENETVWEGNVEVFDLEGHQDAKTCYAWQHNDANGAKVFAILKNHLIDSPQRAIQAAIFVDKQPILPPPTLSLKFPGAQRESRWLMTKINF